MAPTTRQAVRRIASLAIIELHRTPNAIVKDVEFSTTSSYNNTAAASGTPGVCYRGSIDATVVNSLGYTETQGAGTSSFCLPNQGGGSTSPGSGGGSGTVGTGGNTQDCDHTLGGCWSPILINLDSGGYRLTGVDDPVTFDIGANGSPLLLSWTARDASVAFLALDRNHNGRIDDGSELFGNHTPLAGGTPAHEGFEALAQYDANRDSVIDHSDPIWSDLLLWTDRNHDGVSQESELAPLSTSELRSLGCERHFTGRRDEYGNVFRWEARLTQDSRESRPYYDIYFRAAH